MNDLDKIEFCHCDLNYNLNQVITVIHGYEPGHVFGCGDVNEERKQLACRFKFALQAWIDDVLHDTAYKHEYESACNLLGEKTDRKCVLVNHLINKLIDNGYELYPAEEEDFGTVESRIQHCEICNFNWDQNILIILDEIGSGSRTIEWHGTGMFCACGDKDPGNTYPFMLKKRLNSVSDIKNSELLDKLCTLLEKVYQDSMQ